MDANTVFMAFCLNDDENNKMREYIYLFAVRKCSLCKLRGVFR